MRIWTLILCLGLSLAQAIKVKDYAKLEGADEVALVGYGLVVGLNGTGDGTSSSFTIQSTINMLRNLGIEVPSEKIRTKNVAAVMVTAKMTPYHRKGSKLDVTLSSLGDAKSLEGGVLLVSPLQSPEGENMALAQGALVVGGYQAVAKRGGASESKNQTLTGLIPGGAIVQAGLSQTVGQNDELRWILSEPDYASAVAMAEAIKKAVGGDVLAEDAGAVRVKVPAAQKAALAAFIAKAEDADFKPGTSARVVVNERTGTLIAGEDVRILPVAIAHGGIKIVVESTPQVSQPAPLSQGQTAQTTQQTVKVTEEKNEIRVLTGVNNVNDLARGLNAMGVGPRDVVSIFQALKRAGALQAELVVM